jgi:hypothetical protein
VSQRHLLRLRDARPLIRPTGTFSPLGRRSADRASKTGSNSRAGVGKLFNAPSLALARRKVDPDWANWPRRAGRHLLRLRDARPLIRPTGTFSPLGRTSADRASRLGRTRERVKANFSTPPASRCGKELRHTLARRRGSFALPGGAETAELSERSQSGCERTTDERHCFHWHYVALDTALAT